MRWSAVAESDEARYFAKKRYGLSWKGIVLALLIPLMAVLMLVFNTQENSVLTRAFPGLASSSIDTAITLGIFAAFVVLVFLRSSKAACRYVQGQIYSKHIRPVSQPVNPNGSGLSLLFMPRRRVALYIIEMQAEDGSKYSMSTTNKEISELYQPGLLARYHEPFGFIELFDKSRGSNSVCPCCKKKNPPNSERCNFCSCPLFR